MSCPICCSALCKHIELVHGLALPLITLYQLLLHAIGCSSGSWCRGNTQLSKLGDQVTRCSIHCLRSGRGRGCDV